MDLKGEEALLCHSGGDTPLSVKSFFVKQNSILVV